MQLENMMEGGTSPETDILIESEFNFSLNETRESGDGDSGAESSKIVEIKEIPLSNNNKNIKKSKIPVRQIRKKTDTILEAPEGFRQVSPEDDSTGDTIGLTAEVSVIEDSADEVSVNADGVTLGNNDGISPGDVDDDEEQVCEIGTKCASQASIANGAQAPGCSRVSTATGCVALFKEHSSCADTNNASVLNDKQIEDFSKNLCNNDSSSGGINQHLSWTFKNGRLVFETTENERESAPPGHGSRITFEQVVDSEDSDNSQDNNDLLLSKHLNKKIDESRSRLKYLEQKLKQAGITDGDDSTSRHKNDESEEVEDNELTIDEINEVALQDGSIAVETQRICEDRRLATPLHEEEIIPEEEHSFCEFNVNTYNEIISEESMMGTLTEDVPKHNPDRENLKSLLKRPGKNIKKPNNRVVFNENKNEFFDADYIILIREECDYDEEDDDGVCTCNQHEMVRLTCCEPKCNCNYEGYEAPAPQSPKFAPPLEFVDAVTLSPPEGYKDMELGEQQLLALHHMARRTQQRAPVCRECSATHEDNDELNNECGVVNSDHGEKEEEKEKTDQSQQTTPTTPPDESETVNMTTVTDQRIIQETGSSESSLPPPGGSPISGILKGGRLWKQTSLENKPPPMTDSQGTDSSVTSDEEGGGNRRSVRFIEKEEDKREGCDGAPDNSAEESKVEEPTTKEQCNLTTSPESMEMMLTFKLGNHVLISNNSLKPNSAVRQLFPCTKPLNSKDEEVQQYLVTAESLKAFEEAKRAKLPQIIQSGETDESIKRAIERNTLRRSLIRYEPRSKKNVQKTDNSLVERIKQLTCDVDDNLDEIPPRTSPPGEEARNSPDNNKAIPKNDKNFSPSSSSTTSSNSSSMSSTYKKITDLFGKRDKTDTRNNIEIKPLLPDLGNGGHMHEVETNPLAKINSTNDSRKQFLSTLAPLTACVSGIGNGDEFYYQMSNAGERASVASSVGTEYSLEDIDEGLKNDDESKKIAPDVLAGTPSASESGDELAMFVQQDASRIERIKKKYQEQPTKEEDDEHDDYGFNRRPSVRGIKPRFGSTTEILQQIQNQLQPPQLPPVRMAWPYYSESGLTDNSKQRNINQMLNYHSTSQVPEEIKLPPRNFVPQYRPTSLQEENLYQNCASQRCIREIYRTNLNQTYSAVMKVGGCTDYYQSLPRVRNGRPQSPPPLEMSKNYHQTMVYIPYNHIEGYHPTYYQPNNYQVTNQNQINKRYVEPIYQQRIHPEDPHYFPPPKPAMIRPYPHYTRSESPLPGQFSTARSTQTSCNYYNPRFQRPVWQQNDYVTNKMNRHSFPNSGPRYQTPDQISLTTDSEVPNGFRSTVEFNPQQNSPIKPRFIERGVPEGAASVSPQDSGQTNSSTMTSPTSPQNPGQQQKPLFYAMNV